MRLRHVLWQHILFIFTLTCSATAETNSPYWESPLPVFLNCRGCDFDYIRKNIRFVDWVRDQTDANVHVQIISQRTGSGGREYNIDFIGQHDFSDSTKQLKFALPPQIGQDKTREKLSNMIKVGLLPFISAPDLLDKINITYSDHTDKTTRKKVADPWNNWVFEIDADGSLEKEASQKSYEIDGMLSARRITEAWRFQIYLRSDYEKDTFQNQNKHISSSTREHRARWRVVKSLGSHWSAGLRGRIFSNTYDNMDLSLQLGPAIEYSLFNYEEEARRVITLAYSVNPKVDNYTTTTIYRRLDEALLNHAIQLDLRFTLPWGTARAGVEGIHYLNRVDHYRIDSYGRLSLQLFKGFSIYFAGSFNRLNDQFALVRGDATVEQLLLQRRNLATDYEVNADIGLNYTFGSIFNNVVNTRL